MTDNERIAALYRREESVLAEIQRTYRAYAASIAVGILGSRESAEEVCSDVWLRLWQSIPPNRPENLRLYIGRLARNRALSCLESERAIKRSAIRVQLEELQECLPDQASKLEPDAIALRELMADFLGRLPREKRLVFVRRYYYGDTVPQIAHLLGCKPSRVTGILYRTRQELKTRLEQEGFDL